MAAEKIIAPVSKEKEGSEKPAWYDFLIDIFKKLLEFNYTSYGTKKKF
ncbi:MAG: hypothetical protein WBB19_20630 [Desulforhopalus sp.]